ncbi:hypothetical protein AciPR4_1680 [Terriglobus saanensis SP1PR4]|uniref:Uncharacterized protein n=1 Tax=Terriglobus saanensis (strain ATCC BAA-1853 / DSM 23119 / SP1PR4) TaxID=401053 RepID=E8V3D0_TERSS|nr:hypothetical protein AciPR4_1680 [Terriglobus saanensis SP1PR4]
MHPVNPRSRTQWILFSVLLFVGLFTGSLNCKFTQINHAPQRTGSRAVSAHSSLSEIAQRAKRSTPPAIAVSTLFLFFLFSTAPTAVVATRLHECECLHPRSDASLWLPTLMFRPPPVHSFA